MWFTIHMTKKTIALLYGSRSTEHEVSITSAYAVYRELQRMNTYTILPIYISRTGQRHIQSSLDDLSIYENFADTSEKHLLLDLHTHDQKLHLKEQGEGLFAKTKEIIIDVVFPVLHGKAWEDGSIQGLCEMLSVPYVWPRILSAALALDKTISTYVLSSIDVPCIPSQILRKGETVDHILQYVSYPAFVKPYNWWSTIGVSKCKNITELKQWIDVAFYFADEIIIQPSIEEARELNCSVALIDGQVTTTLVQEAHSVAEFLTFDEKYIFEAGGGSMSGIDSKVTIPAMIPEQVATDVMTLAKKIYVECKLYGNARIDFLYQEKENKLYVIEINTIPGALQLYLREKSGITKATILQALIEEACTYNDQRIGNIDFKSNILKNTSSFMKK